MDSLALNLPLTIWTAVTFALGAAVGSFVNVCVGRLPREKSVLWPGSTCLTCLRPIRWYDNVPVVSYLVLRGRCRRCNVGLSPRYLLMELLMGGLFAGLFVAVVPLNVTHQPFIAASAWRIKAGLVPFATWVYYFHHVTLVGFLVTAAACDIQSREIPLGVTVAGTALGLLGAAVWPWPWPHGGLPPDLAETIREPWMALPGSLPRGVQPWPFWGPLPDWLPPGSHLLGFLTGVAGMLAGTFLLRTIRFLFSKGIGKEALGLGDADLMMMVGSFLGWQIVVVAFFVGAMVALVFAVGQLVFFRDPSLPFGPGLAVGSGLTWLLWWHVGPVLQPLFFWNVIVIGMAAFGAVFMLLSALVIRLVRGAPSEATEL